MVLLSPNMVPRGCADSVSAGLHSLTWQKKVCGYPPHPCSHIDHEATFKDYGQCCTVVASSLSDPIDKNSGFARRRWHLVRGEMESQPKNRVLLIPPRDGVLANEPLRPKFKRQAMSTTSLSLKDSVLHAGYLFPPLRPSPQTPRPGQHFPVCHFNNCTCMSR